MNQNQEEFNKPKSSLTVLTMRIWVQFREFFMLFLAVFCGFLADNYREQRQEEEVAIGYLKSMMFDLERDSIQLETMIDLSQNTFRNADSLGEELLSARIETDCRPAFRLLFKNFGFDDFAPNDGTIEQLKHSGSLRFIKEKEIVDAIMDYQGSQVPLKIHETSMNRMLDDLVKLRQNFDLIRLNNSQFQEKFPLLRTDRETRNVFFERIEVWKLYVGRLELLQKNVRQKGQKLRKAILKFHPEIYLVEK